MAILTPSQLQAASNATYFDNTSGSITPTAVRTLNDNWISSSILVTQTGSMSVASASVAGTASFALNFNPSATASYALFAATASNVISASYAFQASNATNANNADQASFANNANTANSANTAVSASNATNATFATTASFALNFNPAATASYALFANTASYALNSVAPFPYTGSAQITGSLTLVGLTPLNVSHVNANDVQGVRILTNTSTTVATFGAGGGTGVTVVGQVNAASFSGSGVAISGVVSSSYASNADLLDNLNFTAFVLTSSFVPFSSSVSDRLTAAPTLTGNNTFSGTNSFNIISASFASVLSASIDYLSVVYQTSSIIFSSGSNIFGDNANDTQTLWGTVNMVTGPVNVSGSLNANGGVVGNLTGTASWATNAINASTASYVLTAQTASYVALAQTASSVSRLVQDVVITGSLITSGTLAVSNAGGIDFQVTNTGTFIGNAMTDVHATTGSFSITGSSTFNGSVNGQVISSSIASSTSSLDFSLGNFYTSLVSGSTRFNITNPKAGQTVNLLLSTIGVATASFSSNVKQVSGSTYTPTSGSGKNDVLTFISWDGTSVYLANVKNLI